MKSIVFFCATIFIFSCNKKESKTDYLGVVKLEVSGTKAAITHFEKGLLLLHSFEFEDSREAFLKAQKIDPKMAMAYWGEAMTYNHPLWREQDYLNGFSALEKLELEGEIKGQSAVEKDFLKAVEILYKPKTSKKDRDTAYIRYMEGLYEKYPANHEIAAFYSLSLLGSVADGRNDSIYGLGADVIPQYRNHACRFACSPRIIDVRNQKSCNSLTKAKHNISTQLRFRMYFTGKVLKAGPSDGFNISLCQLTPWSI